MAALIGKPPSVLYTKEDIMNFVYYVYTRTRIDHSAFLNIKWPDTLQWSISYHDAVVRVRYWNKNIGTIDLIDEKITYLM